MRIEFQNYSHVNDVRRNLAGGMFLQGFEMMCRLTSFVIISILSQSHIEEYLPTENNRLFVLKASFLSLKPFCEIKTSHVSNIEHLKNDCHTNLSDHRLLRRSQRGKRQIFAHYECHRT
jgi:hypothetical protein